MKKLKEVRRAYKVRLYPNQDQERRLTQTIGACRYVFNYFLEQRKNHYLAHKKTLPYALMARQLTTLRREIDWLSAIQAEPLQQSLRRLDVAYRRFFKKRANLPKFKSKKNPKQSFQKHKDWKVDGNKIKIQKDLCIKFRGSIDPSAKLGTLVVSRYSSGKWFATMTAKVEVKTPKRYTKPIGIDVGIETLATLSNGKKYPNIQTQKTLQEKLTKAQRSLARKKIGSNRRKKQKVVVARVYEKIRNIRENHIHQTTHQIVSKNHATIAVESLNVAGMMKNRRLSRAIADVSMREFLRQVKYKQEWIGGNIFELDRFFPSSKTCYACGFVVESLPLEVREWKCPKCKRSHDRDVNAAKVILAQSVGHTERGESGKVSARKGLPVSMKREYAKA